MARSPLIHFDGALFHITARGNDRQRIFHVDGDFRRYLKAIGACQQKLHFTLYAYVLMPNHVHLLIQVGKHSVDRIMQRIQTSYTMYFHKKHQHSGHVFQGRYHWFLIDKDSYLLELIRYIHLNPVRAGLKEDPKDYPWSSHAAYLDGNYVFSPFLARTDALSFFSLNRERQIEIYREFVLAGIGSEWEDILPKPVWGQFVGTDKFIGKMERKIRKKILNSTSGQ